MADWWESSDSEDDGLVTTSTPHQELFRVDWLDLPVSSLPVNTLALSSLPGCRFREHKRDLQQDLGVVLSQGVTDVMVLMEESEFRRYRVPSLLAEFTRLGVTVHHRPIQDGGVPSMAELLSAVSTLSSLVTRRRRVLVHCYGGLGRTCLVVAAYLLNLDPSLGADSVIEMLREVRGPRAVQTVKQYNMIQEFRRMQETQGVVERGGLGASLSPPCC